MSANYNLTRSGREIHQFSAASLADAQTLAQAFSTAFQVPCELRPWGIQTTAVYNYTPGSPAGGTVSIPTSGVGY